MMPINPIPTAADFLVNALRNNATVTGAVQNRIHAAGAETDVYPLITYTKISGGSQYSHSGPSKLGSPIYVLLVQSMDPSERDSLGEAVKQALEAFKGTAGGVECFNCQFLTDSDGFDKTQKIYFRQLTFKVWHREA